MAENGVVTFQELLTRPFRSLARLVLAHFPLSTPCRFKMASHHERNPGIELDLAWVHETSGVNLSALNRRAATLGTRRSVKSDWQVCAKFSSLDLPFNYCCVIK
jgi:hypothetical protein